MKFKFKTSIEPLNIMIGKIEETENYHSKHDQILFTYGFLLRLLTSILGGYYLKINSISSDDINKLVASDLRRPSYGNLLNFLRTCSKSKIVDWGELFIMVEELKKLFKYKNLQIPGEDSKTLLLDAFISYRNRRAHGGAILSEVEYEENTNILIENLKFILKSLPSLSNLKLITDSQNGLPILNLDEGNLLLSPLSTMTDFDQFGFMEGYDTKSKQIRYVSSNNIWQSNTHWIEWEMLLQNFSLLPIHWSKINLDWLSLRAKSIQPFFFVKIDREQISELFNEFILTQEFKDNIYASDPYFASLLLFIFSDYPVFFIELEEINKHTDSYQLLSEYLGVDPSINCIDIGHEVEEYINSVEIIIYTRNEDYESFFSPVLNDFPNLKLRFIKKSSNNDGFNFRIEHYENICRILNIDLKNINQNYLEIKSVFKNAVSGPKKWEELLIRTFGEKPSPHLLDLLYCVLNTTNKDFSNEEILLVLKDIGIIESNIVNSFEFISNFALRDYYKYIIHKSTGRQKQRFLNFPPKFSLEIADILFRNSNLENYSNHSDGLILYICFGISIGDKESIFYSQNIFSQEELHKIGVVFLNFGKPDLYKYFINSIKINLSNKKAMYTDGEVEMISLIRSHSDPKLALELLYIVANSKSKSAIKAKHQIAGILRDSGEQNSLMESIKIYNEILKLEDIDTSQLIWSTCGLAESYYVLGNLKSIDVLEELLTKLDENLNEKHKIIVYHRLASAYYNFGKIDLAIEFSDRILKSKLEIGGALGARIFETHSRILYKLNNNEAIEFAIKALKVKRLIGDRRGIQISLLNISTIIENNDPIEANKMATEALELAKSTNDLKGQLLALKRLKTLNRKNPKEKEIILNEINKLIYNDK